MKILRFISENILFFITLFLLAFIPLYPKLPIINVQHTWVYVRLEDFVVLLTIVFWFILLLRKKITLKTPLTLPIIIYWIVGGISTLHGVLLLFPTLSNVFSNVAFLSMLRRIEYMMLFFVAFVSIKDKKFIAYISIFLAVVLLLVAGYGFGQKFFGFPAFLTMNEEFAKGVPIQLSQLSRVPSTFAGHYDLAAYLVLIIPILVSVAFGFRNWFLKIFLLATSALGFVLLLMTVSRVSFFVILLSLAILLIAQKKKLVIVSLLALTVVLLIFSPSLVKRFGNTVSEINVLVDAKTGAPIGQVREVNALYFKDKLVTRQFVDTKIASSSSIIVPFSLIPPQNELVVEPNSPNGENLPQGTSYINLSLSPVIKKVKEYFYEKSYTPGAKSTEVRMFLGDYVIKRAKAYDLSFTTRFQGEWPRTFLAFERNIFLGSGYGSVSLAVDNDYLRLLGESGVLGFISFISIFLIASIYIEKMLQRVDSGLIRSFVFGFVAGTFGLALNALLIDVFEASKIAFTFWILLGITLGVLNLYKDKDIDLYKELKNLATSSYAVIIYLFIAVFILFGGITGYYFVGDDFTWLRWIVDCGNCYPISTIFSYFTQANGFFYRPGTKLYFDLMYSAFWLNQTMYHFVSIFLHFIVVMLVFFVSRKVLRNFVLSVAVAFLFLILSGYSEVVFWISSTGFLFNAMFAFISLLFFIYWREQRKKAYLVICISSIFLSLLFHEVGVIAPLFIILYDTVFGKNLPQPLLPKRAYCFFIILPLLPYALLRFAAQSHWFSGDYSYNLVKLPFNLIGNTIGYFVLTFLGPSSLPFYDKLRVFLKGHVVISLVGIVILLFLLFKAYRLLIKKVELEDKKIIIFGLMFFIISLLPFLGLGNIASRYSYLPSFGLALFFILLLRKTYLYLLSNGKHIALAMVMIISIIFVSVHLFQLQKAHSDWRVAGERSQSFLTSLNYIYAHYSTENAAQLYFVNVPIRNGDAWVFPVGINDAAWLVFRNENVRVHQVSSASDAFGAMGDSNGRVFKFDERGNIIELIRTRSGEIIPVR